MLVDMGGVFGNVTGPECTWIVWHEGGPVEMEKEQADLGFDLHHDGHVHRDRRDVK